MLALASSVLQCSVHKVGQHILGVPKQAHLQNVVMNNVLDALNPIVLGSISLGAPPHIS